MDLGAADAVVDAAACGDYGGVQSLLARSETTAAQCNHVDKDGRSAFHYACLNDDLRLLELLLADDRVDVSLRTPRGDTCLHLGSLYACLEVLRRLLSEQRFLDLLDAQNNWGETALHLCAGSGDKGAGKTADLLLAAGANPAVADQWHRGPLDVARDNGETAMVARIEEWLATRPEAKAAVEAVSSAYRSDAKPQISVVQTEGKNALMAQLGGLKLSLNKVKVAEKHMFKASAGTVTAKGSGKDARSAGKVLSKLVDFPGDKEEIARLLQDDKVDAAGKDAYGLTALHKFASWNKVDLIELLLPKLTPAQVNERDPDGKTALHWACEMASVAAVTRLVACADVDKDIKDNKGRTPAGILDAGEGSVITRLRLALDGNK